MSIFGPPKDTLLDKLYKDMQSALELQNYELANTIKGNIIHSMGMIDWEGWEAFDGNFQRTVGRIVGGEIRLHPKLIGYEQLLLLSSTVHEEKGSTVLRTKWFRELVADKLIELGIEIPTGKHHLPRRMKPNRAFLDILSKKTNNPDLMNELIRREKSKLWYAMKRGDIKSKEEIIYNIKELQHKRDYDKPI